MDPGIFNGEGAQTKMCLHLGTHRQSGSLFLQNKQTPLKSALVTLVCTVGGLVLCGTYRPTLSSVKYEWEWD